MGTATAQAARPREPKLTRGGFEAEQSMTRRGRGRTWL